MVTKFYHSVMLKILFGEIDTMQKHIKASFMLELKRHRLLDWMSMFFPCREAKLTGFLTCLSIKMNRLWILNGC